MALTDHSDVFASFHENGFNNIIQHIMLQRPSLFNYATADLAKSRKVCKDIKYHPAVATYNNNLFTTVPYMPIFGYSGPYGLSYCFQICDLKIDFHPGNLINLPAELNPPLGEQRIALTGTVCAGLGCPREGVIQDLLADLPREDDGREAKAVDRPFPYGTLDCFCLKLCAVVRVIRNNGFLELRLVDLELKDIRPDGLESALECYISMALQLSILPKVRIAMKDLIFDLEGFVSLVPTPVPADVPFNPAVENDEVAVFFNLS